jgi:hypothetical protein
MAFKELSVLADHWDTRRLRRHTEVDGIKTLDGLVLIYHIPCFAYDLDGEARLKP